MFGSVGMGELILIMGIALVFIGPEKFPEFAKIFLRAMRDLRSYVNDVKNDIRRELDPVKDEVKKLSQYDPEKFIDAMTESEEDDQKNDAEDKTEEASHETEPDQGTGPDQGTPTDPYPPASTTTDNVQETEPTEPYDQD